MAAAKESGVTEEDLKEIIKLVEDLRCSNAVLRTETEMLESFYSRLDSSDLVPQATPESMGAASSMDVGGCSGKSKVQQASQESQQLTLEQKCYIAEREIEEMRKDQEKLRVSSKRASLEKKATIEEAGLRLARIRMERLEFERFVAKIRQEKTPVLVAEKVTRYIEDGMKSKDTQIKKLQRENKALRVHHRKLRLRQNEEKSKALHRLDFQKMKIEKIQYLEQINKCNQDIRQLKMQYRDKQRALNSCKKKLQSLTLESKSLDSAIASRKEKTGKIQKETEKAKKERAKAEAENRKLRAQVADVRVPNVMDYIAVKASHDKLQKSVKAGERKLKIAEIELETHTKAWRKLCAASGGQLASNVTSQNPKPHTTSSIKEKQVNVGSSLLD